jgi:hypothetical protein
MRKPPGDLADLQHQRRAVDIDQPRQLSPGVQSEVTRIAPSAKSTVEPLRSASIGHRECAAPCALTTQSVPTRRSWLSIRPEIRVRRISATRCIAAAAAATRRKRASPSQRHAVEARRDIPRR